MTKMLRSAEIEVSDVSRLEEKLYLYSVFLFLKFEDCIKIPQTGYLPGKYKPIPLRRKKE
jgi:hypothetical protein